MPVLRRGEVVLSAICGIVALAALFLGWLQDPDPIDADDARRTARAALEAAGLEQIEIVGGPTREVYEPDDGRAPIPVWTVDTEVLGGDVTVRFARGDAELVYVEDLTADGEGQLLDDEEFDALVDHHSNPALDRQLRRNLVATGAAGAIVVMSVLLPTVGLQRGVRRR